jgi:hypothetical protein
VVQDAVLRPSNALAFLDLRSTEHLLLPNLLPIPRYFAGISSRKLITSAAIAALIVFGQSGANKGE